VDAEPGGNGLQAQTLSGTSIAAEGGIVTREEVEVTGMTGNLPSFRPKSENSNKLYQYRSDGYALDKVSAPQVPKSANGTLTKIQKYDPVWIRSNPADQHGVRYEVVNQFRQIHTFRPNQAPINLLEPVP
jgi:hypothetical protein